MGLQSLCWSLGSAAALCVALLGLMLLLETAEFAGRLDLSAADAAQLAERVKLPAEARSFRDSGLLPVVWERRTSFSGRLAAVMYRSSETFRRDRSALNVLSLTVVVAVLLAFICLERNRSNVIALKAEIQASVRRMLHRQSLRLGQSDLRGDVTARAGELFGPETDRLGSSVEVILLAWTRSTPLCLALIALGLVVDWLTFLLVLLPLQAAWILWRAYDRKYRESEVDAGRRAAEDLRLLTDGLRNARVVRGFGMLEFEHSQFQALIDDYHRQQQQALSAHRRSWLFGALIGIGAVAAVAYLLLAKMVAGNGFGFPTAIALLLDVLGISLAMRSLSDLPRSQTAAAESAAKLFEFINRPPEIGQAVGAKFIPPVSRSIYLESVSYAATPGSAPLLKNLDLKIRAGEKLALVSLDPLASRALAWMMPRFIEPQSGRILFDGEDIAWGTLESIRAETILISASDPLLTGTVLENLTGGSNEYSLQDATEAAKLARAHNFIVKLPQGYETRLGHQGRELNVSERFRLSLARALLREPSFLIIDEPHDGLDADSKALLDDAYQRIFAERTVLILPGRLSTVKKAERVILLHDGKVDAVGTHASLVKSHPLYRHWEYVHFNEFRSAPEANGQ